VVVAVAVAAEVQAAVAAVFQPFHGYEQHNKLPQMMQAAYTI
jgi:hypothetical protein